MGIKKELAVVRKALRKDRPYGLYGTWQSYIAMAFYDKCYDAGIKHKKVHAVANEAAKNFLNLLIEN